MADALRWASQDRDGAGMTDIERRMLEELRDRDGAPIGPGYLGTQLWDNANQRKPQAFARPAGRVLNRLKRQGYAAWIQTETGWGWIITSAGERALESG